MMERPEAGSYSATSSRTEFDPTSMAAMRSRVGAAEGETALGHYTRGWWPAPRRRSSAWCLMDLPFDQEDDVLADVGGEVGHPLQIPAHQEELHAGADHVRILHHVREQDPEHRPVERVHLVVPQADLASRRRRRPG